ncbi:SLC13 family permease [Enteractinococcus fodinae]|uniref:Sodium-dependent dicarboxylate transporter SdcS n=1 Tax=Enteractinococcus fodinae TaxID=684663 RepID=A0ABU2B0Y3_9MICC|nr:DASS family sodium-coupled anion symporter [Enteractinococcus fodinae]MDR7346029.1 sodium-dependent dicarboxylate transporter 2/3/5 [Enteractinococcus fodinae]
MRGEQAEDPAEDTQSSSRGPVTKQRIGLVLGPLLFAVFFFIPAITDLEDAPRAVLAVTLWVGTWWITEPIPIPATSLLPIILLPVTGGTDQETATTAYGDPIVFMYLGGFIIAMAIQRWGLHRRIAMTIIQMVGTSGSRIMLGVILACAFLSMWISNAATALMMLPIGLALVEEVRERELYDEKSFKRFATGLMLSIAYASTIGGLATLIGSVPNAVFAAQASILLDQEVTFASWMLFAGPMTLMMLLVLYLLFTRVLFKVSMQVDTPPDFVKEELKKLGPISYEEKVVLAVFATVGTLWISSGFIPEEFRLSDTTISILGAAIMFLIPAREREGGGGVLVWQDLIDLPWGILLLFGGGLSLAAAFEDSDLTSWFGDLLEGLDVLPYALIIIALAAIILFMTEIMSNTAVSNMLIPVAAGMALAMGVDPYSIMALVAISSSCAFMLPVATPPNAAVFSSGHITMDDMIKAGFWMNITAITLASLFILFWQPVVLSGV